MQKPNETYDDYLRRMSKDPKIMAHDPSRAYESTMDDAEKSAISHHFREVHAQRR